VSHSSPISSVNAAYLDSLEATYRDAPDELDASWRLFFDVLHDLSRGDAGAALAALRHDGHLLADLSPIGCGDGRVRTFDGGALRAALKVLPGDLQRRYTGTFAVETAHIDDLAMRQWVHRRLESPMASLPADERVRALHRLIEAAAFERFLALRFPGKKRFGAEGCEAIVPMMERLLMRAIAFDVEAAYIGTMHRARMNLMVNVLGKPASTLLRELKGTHPFPSSLGSAADVPYHLGHVSEFRAGRGSLRVTLLPNPSHLEAVNAVVAGRARAHQDGSGVSRQATLPIVLHTDASVVAQGVVAETLQLSAPTGYRVGGTVHIVIDNQLGFTTEPRDARTSTYCTGPWRAVDSLIVHVNGDDLEACLRAIDLAIEFRQTHARDAVVHLVCYRRHGHNEFDEPRYTQPLMYAQVDAQPTLPERYAGALASEGLVTHEACAAIARDTALNLSLAYEEATRSSPVHAAEGLESATECNAPSSDTTVARSELLDMVQVLSTVPASQTLHSNLRRQVDAMARCADTGIPWATAESLALGSLLRQGLSIRLSGQDVTRGAFSQRHLAWFDQKSGARHVPLAELARNGARFCVHDSPLSEYAALAFEYGFSIEARNTLVVWEAQFGDFANGAQIVFDQFITSGEAKWQQRTNLVILLPHGLEGQGPEHSSARIERLLQSAAENNLRIAHPTTPANYFHLLREQALCPIRKPLIVVTPKALLRHPEAVSPPDAFSGPARYAPLAEWHAPAPIQRVLLCNGKIAYDLRAACAASGRRGIAVVTLEQLYPLPSDALVALIRRLPQAEFTWVQEEPANMGAWSFVARPLERLLQRCGIAAPLGCVARPESASPAGSFHGSHASDQERLVREALQLDAS
jgi:2-oxoglutarate dehydrogenase E1 component